MDIKELILKLKSAIENQEHEQALRISENMMDDSKEILQPHWEIQSSDEQYSDPEMWDYEPVYDFSKKVFSILCDIDRWYMEDEGYDDIDLEHFKDIKELIDTFITENRLN